VTSVVYGGLGNAWVGAPTVPAKTWFHTPFDQPPSVNYQDLETPAVFRSGRADRRAQVEALQNAGMDKYEIPAFLRRQAD
jgi:cell division protein FtsZ